LAIFYISVSWANKVHKIIFNFISCILLVFSVYSNPGDIGLLWMKCFSFSSSSVEEVISIFRLHAHYNSFMEAIELAHTFLPIVIVVFFCPFFLGVQTFNQCKLPVKSFQKIKSANFHQIAVAFNFSMLTLETPNAFWVLSLFGIPIRDKF
jgi:hypothetical protein